MNHNQLMPVLDGCPELSSNSMFLLLVDRSG
jgi:hypothetical protein